MNPYSTQQYGAKAPYTKSEQCTINQCSSSSSLYFKSKERDQYQYNCKSKVHITYIFIPGPKSHSSKRCSTIKPDTSPSIYKRSSNAVMDGVRIFTFYVNSWQIMQRKKNVAYIKLKGIRTKNFSQAFFTLIWSWCNTQRQNFWSCLISSMLPNANPTKNLWRGSSSTPGVQQNTFCLPYKRTVNFWNSVD